MRVLKYLIIASAIACILGAPNELAKKAEATSSKTHVGSISSSERSDTSETSNESSNDAQSDESSWRVNIEKAAKAVAKKESSKSSSSSSVSAGTKSDRSSLSSDIPKITNFSKSQGDSSESQRSSDESEESSESSNNSKSSKDEHESSEMNSRDSSRRNHNSRIEGKEESKESLKSGELKNSSKDSGSKSSTQSTSNSNFNQSSSSKSNNKGSRDSNESSESLNDEESSSELDIEGSNSNSKESGSKFSSQSQSKWNSEGWNISHSKSSNNNGSSSSDESNESLESGVSSSREHSQFHSRTKASDANSQRFNENANSTWLNSESSDSETSEQSRESEEFSRNTKSNQLSNVLTELWILWKRSGNNTEAKGNNSSEVDEGSFRDSKESWNEKRNEDSSDSRETSEELDTNRETDIPKEELWNFKSSDHGRQSTDQYSHVLTKSRDKKDIQQINIEINSWKGTAELSLMHLIIQINGHALNLQIKNNGTLFQKGCEERQLIIERAIANLERHVSDITINWRNVVVNFNIELREVETQLHVNIKKFLESELFSTNDESSNFVYNTKTLHERVALTIKKLRIKLWRIYRDNENHNGSTNGSRAVPSNQSESSNIPVSTPTSTITSGLETILGDAQASSDFNLQTSSDSMAESSIHNGRDGSLASDTKLQSSSKVESSVYDGRNGSAGSATDLQSITKSLSGSVAESSIHRSPHESSGSKANSQSGPIAESSVDTGLHGSTGAETDTQSDSVAESNKLTDYHGSSISETSSTLRTDSSKHSGLHEPSNFATKSQPDSETTSDIQNGWQPLTVSNTETYRYNSSQAPSISAAQLPRSINSTYNYSKAPSKPALQSGSKTKFYNHSGVRLLPDSDNEIESGIYMGSQAPLISNTQRQQVSLNSDVQSDSETSINKYNYGQPPSKPTAHTDSKMKLYNQRDAQSLSGSEIASNIHTSSQVPIISETQTQQGSLNSTVQSSSKMNTDYPQPTSRFTVLPASKTKLYIQRDALAPMGSTTPAESSPIPSSNWQPGISALLDSTSQPKSYLVTNSDWPTSIVPSAVSPPQREWNTIANSQPHSRLTTIADWPSYTDFSSNLSPQAILIPISNSRISDHQYISGSSVSSFPETKSNPAANFAWQTISDSATGPAVQVQSTTQSGSGLFSGSTAQSLPNLVTDSEWNIPSDSSINSIPQVESDLPITYNKKISSDSKHFSQGRTVFDWSPINESPTTSDVWIRHTIPNPASFVKVINNPNKKHRSGASSSARSTPKSNYESQTDRVSEDQLYFYSGSSLSSAKPVMTNVRISKRSQPNDINSKAT